MTSLWKHAHPIVPGAAFEPGSTHDVVVVGAGITGLATALTLVRAGLDVALVEKGEVAELATGGNTGKVSLLQGTTLSELRRHHPAGLVRAYVDANRAGADWVAETATELGVDFSRRTAYTYAQSGGGVTAVHAEHDAAREAGLDTRIVGVPEMATAPFDITRAVALDDQIAIDPVRFADALAAAFVAQGGRLYTRTAVRRVHVTPRPTVETDFGELFADHVVLATATPIMDRGLYFAKTSGLRSSCVSFVLEGHMPDGMYLAADAPTRSIRTVSAADGPAEIAQVIVGGAGHPVGRAESELALLEELVQWARATLPVGAETHRWSAQDYRSHNLVPFIGTMPRTLGRVSFATGYATWGLTNGPAAALRIAAEIRGEKKGERPDWMTTLGTRMTVPADLARGAVENATVAKEAARGWAEAERTPVPVPRPAEGDGVVAQRGGHPVGVSTTGGTTRAVDAVCPHLGGVLEWNDLACTWDCPLHASRFAADGTRIEGPAVNDLRRFDAATESTPTSS
ncbi:FAD-dependent oxidoreductase [Microbacterium sp. P04]|uniref:FAD-dependent oxidoreductase n=1 Tax=Microbacterium sp. P04 TaxID=3366947 RepID=UPI00374610A6